MKAMLVIIVIAIALVVYLQQPTRSRESSGATRNVPSAAASAAPTDADGPTTRPNRTIVIAPVEDGSLETRWKKPQSTASLTNPH